MSGGPISCGTSIECLPICTVYQIPHPQVHCITIVAPRHSLVSTLYVPGGSQGESDSRTTRMKVSLGMAMRLAGIEPATLIYRRSPVAGLVTAIWTRCVQAFSTALYR